MKLNVDKEADAPYLRLDNSGPERRLFQTA